MLNCQCRIWDNTCKKHFVNTVLQLAKIKAWSCRHIFYWAYTMNVEKQRTIKWKCWEDKKAIHGNILAMNHVYQMCIRLFISQERHSQSEVKNKFIFCRRYGIVVKNIDVAVRSQFKSWTSYWSLQISVLFISELEIMNVQIKRATAYKVLLHNKAQLILVTITITILLLMPLQFKRKNVISQGVYIRDHTSAASRDLTKLAKEGSPSLGNTQKNGL